MEIYSKNIKKYPIELFDFNN